MAREDAQHRTAMNRIELKGEKTSHALWDGFRRRREGKQGVSREAPEREQKGQASVHEWKSPERQIDMALKSTSLSVSVPVSWHGSKVHSWLYQYWDWVQ